MILTATYLALVGTGHIASMLGIWMFFIGMDMLWGANIGVMRK